MCSSSFKVIELSGIIEQSARSDRTCVIRAEFRLPFNRNVALTNFSTCSETLLYLHFIYSSVEKEKKKKKNAVARRKFFSIYDKYNYYCRIIMKRSFNGSNAKWYSLHYEIRKWRLQEAMFSVFIANGCYPRRQASHVRRTKSTK